MPYGGGGYDLSASTAHWSNGGSYTRNVSTAGFYNVFQYITYDGTQYTSNYGFSNDFMYKRDYTHNSNNMFNCCWASNTPITITLSNLYDYAP